jgi:hypothetical protein
MKTKMMEVAINVPIRSSYGLRFRSSSNNLYFTRITEACLPKFSSAKTLFGRSMTSQLMFSAWSDWVEPTLIVPKRSAFLYTRDARADAVAKTLQNEFAFAMIP